MLGWVCGLNQIFFNIYFQIKIFLQNFKKISEFLSDWRIFILADQTSVFCSSILDLRILIPL